MKLTVFSLSIAAAFSGSFAVAAVTETVDSADGSVIAASDNGMTLYTFRKDTAGASSCYDACAGNWPPFLTSADNKAMVDGDLTVIERTDGTYQWAIKGMPLYFFAGDAAKGDAKGDGVKEVWDAVRPN